MQLQAHLQLASPNFVSHEPTHHQKLQKSLQGHADREIGKHWEIRKSIAGKKQEYEQSPIPISI